MSTTSPGSYARSRPSTPRSRPGRRWQSDGSMIAGFAHPALFYRDAAEFIAGTVPFIREGLAAGEPVAVAVPRSGLELIRAELGYDAARTTLIDMAQAGRNPGRIIPSVLR